jgi:hypothetical protein
MIPLYHGGGPLPCQGVALMLLKDQASRYDIPADNVVLIDGSKPKRGDYIFCGSCGQPLSLQFLSRR